MTITVQTFTPILREGSDLDGGTVTTAEGALDALMQFRALYPEGELENIDTLGPQFEMDAKDYYEFHARED